MQKWPDSRANRLIFEIEFKIPMVLMVFIVCMEPIVLMAVMVPTLYPVFPTVLLVLMVFILVIWISVTFIFCNNSHESNSLYLLDSTPVTISVVLNFI